MEKKEHTKEKGDSMQKIIIALLSVFIGVGITQITLSIKLTVAQNNLEERVQKINDDYTPLFVIDAILESNQLMTKELIGIKENDQDKVRQIQNEYFSFQRKVISSLAKKRGLSYNDNGNTIGIKNLGEALKE
jgi:flagellar basal body-associated protein FliL